MRERGGVRAERRQSFLRRSLESMTHAVPIEQPDRGRATWHRASTIADADQCVLNVAIGQLASDLAEESDNFGEDRIDAEAFKERSRLSTAPPLYSSHSFAEPVHANPPFRSRASHPIMHKPRLRSLPLRRPRRTRRSIGRSSLHSAAGASRQIVLPRAPARATCAPSTWHARRHCRP